MAEVSTAQVVEREVEVLGRRARVFTGGEGSPALLLLHGGWGGAALHWSGVWNRLARRAQVIAPDLPGVGDPAQPGRASLAGYVTWLLALLDALGVGQVHCVGNSFGASLAWSFAGRSPDRCRGVVLVDGIPMPRTPAPLLWLGRGPLGRGLVRLALKRLSFTPLALPRAFADPRRAPPALLGTLRRTPPAQLDAFVDCVIAGDGPPAPRAPVLVLWGERDRLPGTGLAAGRRLGAALPGARFVSLSDAGHFPQLERPAAFVEAVESFVDGVGG
jgi:2-hydroxy-6-oxonona-2,4-dienedioate hydrolase